LTIKHHFQFAGYIIAVSCIDEKLTENKKNNNITFIGW